MTLDLKTRRMLQYLPQAGASTLNPSRLACWNWALAGLRDVEAWRSPDHLFDYVSSGANPDLFGGQTTELPPQVQQIAGVQGVNELKAMIQAWQPFANAAENTPERKDLLHRINTALVKAAIVLNGLKWADGRTPYQVAMHYDEVSGQTLNGPNFTHWWLEIDGGGLHHDGVEAFPGSAHLTIRRPNYGHNDGSTCRVYIENLHTHQAVKISQLVQDVVDAYHHAPPRQRHTGWPGQANACVVCGTPQQNGPTCHCCRKPVCWRCSEGSAAFTQRWCYWCV